MPPLDGAGIGEGRDKPRLNSVGWLLHGLVFAVGVAAFAYVGLTVGMVAGVIQGGEKMESTPTKGIGMAPDLSGLVEGAFAFGVATVVGTGLGFLTGLVGMWAGCRYLLAPLLRRVPSFTRHSTRTHLP